MSERQEELDQLLHKTQIEMHATVQLGGRSPKPINGPTSTSQLKQGFDNVQSATSFPSQAKGKKRERTDHGSEPVKRKRSSKTDDGDSGQFKPESILKSEISKITEKGGLVDSGVERLIQLMQSDRAERKMELISRSMLASVIAATEKFDCLVRFVQLKGLPVLNEWLQDVHKGKIGDGSPKDGDKSVEKFLLVLLRALDKLPVNLYALHTCNIGKSVNHLRSHRNLEIQKKARNLVDTWKKRVEAEMNIINAKSGSTQVISWPSRSRLPEVSHGGNRNPSGSSEAAMKSSVSQLSASKTGLVKLVQGEYTAKSTSLSPVPMKSAVSPASGKDGQHRIAVGNNISAEEAEEFDEAICSMFEAAGLNQPSPSTSGWAEFSFENIFANLEDLSGDFSEGMVGENLTEMARKKNAERMAAQKKAEATHSELTLVKTFVPVIEETVQVAAAEMGEGVEQQVIDEQLIPEERGEKRSAEGEAGSEISLAAKQPRLEELDVVAPFIVRPKIKDTPISSDASAIEDPAVALSLAASISLPADNAAFRAVPDVVAVDLSAQSALLTVGRIADLGRRLHDALGRIERLQEEVDGQKSRAESEVMRAAVESARAEAEKERACSAEQFRSDVESKANASEESLKLAKEALAEANVKLAELKAAKEKADSEASGAFKAGKSAAFTEYVDKVPKFENRGFKHGWLKALAAAGVTLALPIPYERVDIEPLESDPED